MNRYPKPDINDAWYDEKMRRYLDEQAANARLAKRRQPSK